MDPIAVKLDQQPLKLNFFEKNQVLTHEHLNNFIQYFDYEQRLTRSALTGSGIAGGLKLLVRKDGIVITRGVGVTSDGDLIWMKEDRVLNSVIPFDDKNAKYKPFINGNAQVKLFELTDGSSSSTDQQKLSDFFSDANPASGFAVILYLEQYLLDSDLCSAENCDNAGVMERSDVHALLIAKADLDRIITDNACAADLHATLPAMAAQRVLINPSSNIFTFQALSDLYESAITEMVKQLQPAMAQADASVKSMSLCLIKNGSIPAKTADGKNAAASLNFNAAASLSKITDALNKFAGKAGIQYVYDWVKDVTEAYNEFRDAMYDFNCQTCPDPDAFPKHLMLGDAQSGSVKKSRYRHDFIESPVLNHRDDLMQSALNRYARIVALLNQFTYEPGRDNDIRVTPSGAIHEKMGYRAIPFYYSSKVSVAWSDEKSRRGDTNLIQSYRAAEYSSLKQVTEPLSFNLDSYRFFRVEGHIGKPFETVNAELQKKLKDFDLPFDVIGLQIEDHLETVFPRFPFTPVHLQPHFELIKSALNDHLDRVSKYQQSLVDQMPVDIESKVSLFAGVSSAASVATDATKRIQSNRTRVMQKSNDALNEMNKGLNALSVDAISSHLSEIVGATAEIETDSDNLTTASRFSPATFSVNNAFISNLSRLKDLWKIHEDDDKSKYIFTNFLNVHQALLHNGGVCRGGTFILLYESDSKNVVADFYVPYMIPAPPAPSFTLPPLTVNPIPIDWKQHIRFEAITPKLVNDVTLRNLNVISKQVLTINPSAVLPGTSATVPGKDLVFTPPSDFWDKNLGAFNSTLELATNEKAEIDNRIKTGTATDDDTKRAEELDNIIATNTKLALDHISSNEGNVGAEETQVLNTISRATSTVTTETAKTNISSTVEATISKTSNTTFNKNLGTIGNIIRR